MDKFRVGQKVRVILEGSAIKGDVVVILSQRVYSNTLGLDGIRRRSFTYNIDLPKYKGEHIAYEEHELEAVYDGDESSSWQECAWKPKEKVI